MTALCWYFSYATIRLYSKEEAQVPIKRRKQLKRSGLLKVVANVELLLPHEKPLVSKDPLGLP